MIIPNLKWPKLDTHNIIWNGYVTVSKHMHARGGASLSDKINVCHKIV